MAERICSHPGCDRPAGLPGTARGLCRRHYKAFPKAKPSLEERFRRRVDVSAADSCWPYTGPVDSSGYGRFSWRPGGSLAHRFAYQLFVGPIPPGLHVLHHCDNPPCCRPDHLFLGTQADNNADRDVKGRHRSLFTIGARGQDHPRAKLTQQQVDEIRRIFAAGGISKAELGRRYGMNRTTIYDIVTGKNWH